MKSKILWWLQRADCGRPVARFARLSLVVSFMCSLLAASASAAPLRTMGNHWDSMPSILQKFVEVSM